VETDYTGDSFCEKTIEKTILRVLGSSEFSHSLGQKQNSPTNFQVENEMSSVRERYGEAFWRAHHEAWVLELNQMSIARLTRFHSRRSAIGAQNPKPSHRRQHARYSTGAAA
jgi:hypothetical protein